ncbi:hypothetical protein [Corynebacterium sp. TAE3-ERU30]|uniref:hypothetical protein n=1 Tax=Corynebacterium sp. TAE3-ERU30 TaxID=2849496 RepID=UPI001C4816C2|nr:hypothetical protein [Corynebacterium sp. TAE3-ERU30]MBV7282280.1 hypothetical protein [Corynebacterium sp. TAE3-ERU30]
MKKIYTWCFFTTFVCRYDQLNEAKQRHQYCTDKVREKYNVHFSSEQAYQQGQSNLLFDLLLLEIVGNDTELSLKEKENYSSFSFVTVVDIPCEDDSYEDEFRSICDLLEIDLEEGFPAKFPSRTRGILVSPGGREFKECDYQ